MSSLTQPNDFLFTFAHIYIYIYLGLIKKSWDWGYKKKTILVVISLLTLNSKLKMRNYHFYILIHSNCCPLFCLYCHNVCLLDLSAFYCLSYSITFSEFQTESFLHSIWTDCSRFIVHARGGNSY